MSQLLASKIVSRLDALAEQNHKTRPVRDYIGGSVIGHACDAYIMMDMRGWPTVKKASTIRAAKLGHVMETMIVDELIEAGLIVITVNPTTGEQYEYTSHGGRFQCHLDGFVTVSGETHVLEIKSAKHSRFIKMQREGIRTGDRLYYDQVMTAMAMSGVHRAVFLARDKDSGATHCEIVEFDPMHWAYIEMKISRLLASDKAERIASSPEYHRCKMCDRATWCWSDKPPVGTWMPEDHKERSLGR